MHVDAVGLCRADDGVNNSACVRSLSGISKEPIFAADGEGTNMIFNPVIGELSFAAFKEYDQGFPLTSKISERIAKF